MGMVFHFVSLTERAMLDGHFSLTVMSIHESESLLAFVILLVFLLMYWKYRTLSPGIFIFPLVFLLSFASSIAQQPINIENPVLRGGWIAAHVALIFSGYAALGRGGGAGGRGRRQ